MIETKFVCLKYLFFCICFQIFATPKSLVCFPAIPETKDETTCRKYNKRCCLRSFIFTSSLAPSVPMFTTIMAIFFYLLRAKLVFELCEDLVWFILIWFYTTSKIFWTFFGSFCRIIFGNSEAVAGISFFFLFRSNDFPWENPNFVRTYYLFRFWLPRFGGYLISKIRYRPVVNLFVMYSKATALYLVKR